MNAAHGIRIVTASLAAVLLSSCSSFAYVNKERSNPGATRAASKSSDGKRATLAVNGDRGNPRVLMFLTMSGGGSRAAVWSTEAMLRLQSAFEDMDLLAEVDVISAVSGGSMAAAHYATTRDNDLCNKRLATALHALGVSSLRDAAAVALLRTNTDCPSDQPRAPTEASNTSPYEPELTAPLEPFSVLKADPRSGRIICTARLGADDRRRLEAELAQSDVRRIARLCDQDDLARRGWNADEARGAMRRNYLARWFANMFWPTNILRYWFTAFDRADIMANTLADNLYDTPLLGRDPTLQDLNPTRPYLIINATQASTQGSDDDYAFGSIFAFTEEDFQERLNSDIASFPLARAVMASSAFPLVFANSTLRDFRPHKEDYCELPQPDGSVRCSSERYLHVFDGGNADNLGLRSVKRILLQMAADQRLDDYDAIVVMTIDAYGRPRGASPISPDPRGLVGLFLDPNLTDAVDSLLQANRSRLLEEFENSQLGWRRDCAVESRHLPRGLCEALDKRDEAVLLEDKLVFYHVGFADVMAFASEDFPANRIKAQLDAIPTSFMISDAAADLLKGAAERVLGPTNPCLIALSDLLRQQQRSLMNVQVAQTRCKDVDRIEPRDLQQMKKMDLPSTATYSDSALVAQPLAR